MIAISACANQLPQTVWCNFVNPKLYRTTASRYSTVNVSAIVKPATLELDLPYPLCDKSAGNRPHDSARVPPYRLYVPFQVQGDRFASGDVPEGAAGYVFVLASPAWRGPSWLV